MWGIAGAQKKSEVEVHRRVWSTSQDLVNPKWEQRHPTGLFFICVCQIILMCLTLYFCVLPGVQFSQYTAIRTHVEGSQLSRHIKNCSGQNMNICSYSKVTASPKSNATNYADLKTMPEVYAWLRNTIAVLYQGAFVGNHNQIYSVDLEYVIRNINYADSCILSLEQSALVKETDDNYVGLLNQSLGKTPWEINRKHSKTYFRTQNGSLYSDLETLFTNGWFDPTTTKVGMSMKLFNGLIGSWVILRYTFEQSPAGVILKSCKPSAVNLTLTTDPELAAQLCYLWIFVLLILWESIRETLIIFETVRNMKTLERSAVVGEVELTWKQYATHYSKRRGLVLIIKIFKLLFVLGLVYRLLRYTVAAPTDVLTASQDLNTDVPENSALTSNLHVFVIIGGVSIFLMCANALIQCSRIHLDFSVVLNTMKYFFSLFYGCFILFALLWFSWTLSNHLSLGSSHESFHTFYFSLIYTFRCFFGEPYESFALDDPAQFPRFLQFVAVQLSCHIIIIPLCIAAGSHFYAFAESHRIAAHGNQPTGDWILRKCRRGCQRYCFCFTPDPTQTFQLNVKGVTELSSLSKSDSKPLLKDTGRPDDKTVHEIAAESAQATVSTKWNRRLMILFFLYLIPNVIGVIILLNMHNEFQFYSLNRGITATESFFVSSTVPPFPYDTDNQSLLPNRTVLLLNQTVPYTIEDVISPSNLRNWILDVLLLRLMNPQFFADRHAVPLANPFIIVFSVSYPFVNRDPFFSTMWPTDTLDEPSADDIFLSDSSFIEQGGDSGIQEPYAHVTPYGGDPPDYYILEMYYGPLDSVYNQTLKVLNHYDLFGWKTREIAANWIEYNGDGRIFNFNSVVASVRTTGNISISVDSRIFHEASGEAIYTDRYKSKVTFFSGGSFPALLVACILFAFFASVKIWGILTRRMKVEIFGSILDFFLLSLCIFLLTEMSQGLLPSFEPLWDMLESPDSSVPFPTDSEIPGPSIVYPSDPSISGQSVYLPSRARSLRLLRQMTSLVRYRRLLFGMSAYGTLIGIFRFLLFFAEFPNAILATLSKIYTRVRWKINMLVMVLLLIGLGMVSLLYLCLGPLIPGFSTPKSAVISGWLIATAVWNLKYSDHFYSVGYFIAQVGFVLLWVFILNNLVIAALLYGLRTSSMEKYSKMKIELFHTWNLKSRETQVIRANKKVILYWDAVAKALHKQKRKGDTDGDFARQIDYFFLRFRTSSTFTRPPANIEDYLNRSIQAQNLTRIQQYLADIIMVECKTALVREDLENVKEMSSRVYRTSEGKSKYIRTLQKKLDVLREKLSVIQDNIAFQKADFRPDVVEFAAASVDPHGRHLSEHSIQRQVEMEALSKKREKRLKRIEKKRQKQKEAFEASEVEDHDAACDPSKGGGIMVFSQPDFQPAISREKRRSTAREDLGSSEDEWVQARRALLYVPTPEETPSPEFGVSSPLAKEKSDKKKRKKKTVGRPDEKQENFLEF